MHKTAQKVTKKLTEGGKKLLKNPEITGAIAIGAIVADLADSATCGLLGGLVGWLIGDKVKKYLEDGNANR